MPSYISFQSHNSKNSLRAPHEGKNIDAPCVTLAISVTSVLLIHTLRFDSEDNLEIHGLCIFPAFESTSLLITQITEIVFSHC